MGEMPVLIEQVSALALEMMAIAVNQMCPGMRECVRYERSAHTHTHTHAKCYFRQIDASEWKRARAFLRYLTCACVWYIVGIGAATDQESDPSNKPEIRLKFVKDMHTNNQNAPARMYVINCLFVCFFVRLNGAMCFSIGFVSACIWLALFVRIP